VQKVASHLDIILYSKAQIQMEDSSKAQELANEGEDYDWGIISIKPQDLDVEIPMDPITVMRNALGTE